MSQIGSRGDKLNLLIRQGTTFGPVRCRMKSPGDAPVDLTGAVVRAAMRKSYSSNTDYQFVCTITEPEDGRFEFMMTDEVSATIPCGPNVNDPASTYVWDMEIEYTDGSVKPLMYGTAKVAGEATKHE
jgi:hypothetical protein